MSLLHLLCLKWGQILFLHTTKLEIESVAIKHLLKKNTVIAVNHPLLKGSLPFVGL